MAGASGRLRGRRDPGQHLPLIGPWPGRQRFHLRGRDRDRTGRAEPARSQGRRAGSVVGRCAQGGRGAPTNRCKLITTVALPERWPAAAALNGLHPVFGVTNPGSQVRTRGRRAGPARCGPRGGPGPSAVAPSTYPFPGLPRDRIGRRNLRNRKRLDPYAKRPRRVAGPLAPRRRDGPSGISSWSGMRACSSCPMGPAR